jgi:hypothetical protein
MHSCIVRTIQELVCSIERLTLTYAHDNSACTYSFCAKTEQQRQNGCGSLNVVPYAAGGFMCSGAASRGVHEYAGLPLKG